MFNYFTKTRLERVELSVRIIAIFIAGIWAIYVFIFQNITVPSSQPTMANIRSDFQKIGEDDSSYYYYLKVSLKNESNKVEKFPASYFNLKGYKVEKRNQYNPRLNHDTLQAFSKFSSYKKGSDEYFYGGRLFSVDLILTPSEEQTTGYAIIFPKNKYDIVEVFLNTVQCNPSTKVLPKWTIDDSRKRIDLKLLKNGITEMERDKDQEFIKCNNMYFPEYYSQYYVGDSQKDLQKKESDNK